MLGSDFVRTYAAQNFRAWEAAIVQGAVSGGADLCPWPWVDLTLEDGHGNTVTLSILSDVLAVGTLEDHVRMPLTPGAAQSVCNAMGWMLPTPWIVYQAWRQATTKLEPKGLPNLGVNLAQFAAHSLLLDEELRDAPPGVKAGLKKHVVVSKLMTPGKVVIFGWYRPSPPAADVFDDHRGLSAPGRQPVQPHSNAHGDFYEDYSHGIQPVGGTCSVNGRPMLTADLYAHPVLAALVSHEGALRNVRYPSSVAPPSFAHPASPALRGNLPNVVAQTPGVSNEALGRLRKT